MELRRVCSEEEARAAMAAVAASGMARRVWARQNGINPRSLNAWRLNLARRGGGAPPPLRLVEVTPPVPAQMPAVYVVVTGDIRLEVGDDFREDTLRRLVGVLRSC